MDLKKLQGTDTLATPNQNSIKNIDKVGGPSFGDTLSGTMAEKTNVATKNQASTLNTLASLQMGGMQSKPISDLKFSNHAIERMQSRGMFFNPQELKQINEAVQRAAAKGSKDSLILMDKAALIVSVKNNTVVTVMDKNALKENVFTNIDSTIVMS